MYIEDTNSEIIFPSSDFPTVQIWKKQRKNKYEICILKVSALIF